MKRILFALLVTVLLATVFSAATAEDMLDGIEKQLGKLIADMDKKYKVVVTYQLDERNMGTMNAVFGFCSRLTETIESDKEADWKKQIKKVKELAIHVHNTKEMGELQIRELASNKLIVFFQSRPDYKKLLQDLIYEKQSYIDLSEQAAKLKMTLAMGHDMCWSDAAVFIRSMEEYLGKNAKIKKYLREMTLLLEKTPKASPDYPNRVLPVTYNMDKDTLLHKMENFSEEFAAYDKAQKTIAELDKVGVKVMLAEPLKTATFDKLWRAIEPATRQILEATKTELSLSKLSRKPIIFTPEQTSNKEDGFYISIFDTPDAIRRLL
jgi:hypothetical protein